jgi:hypothetical protein
LFLRLRLTCWIAADSIVGPEGREQVSKSSKKTHKGNSSAAKSAAISTDLTNVVAAWPTLPVAIRNVILALINAAK